MKPERSANQYTIEKVAEIAKQAALEHDGHIPTLIVEGNEGSTIGHLPDLPGTHEARCQMMYAAGSFLAVDGRIGLLNQVFFICEGWMSVRKEGEELKTLPSKDPDRIEVLIVDGYDAQKLHNQAIFLEIKRDSQKRVCELTDLDQDFDRKDITTDSPLLKAFVAGFRKGKSKLH